MVKQGVMLGLMLAMAPAAYAGTFASSRQSRGGAEVQRNVRQRPNGKNVICLGTRADCEALHAKARVEAKIEELRSQKNLEQLDVTGW